MLHDQDRDHEYLASLGAVTLDPTTHFPSGQRLRPVKVIDPDYEKYCNLLLNGAWRHRAPHANRPTPPKRKWAWALELAPA